MKRMVALILVLVTITAVTLPASAASSTCTYRIPKYNRLTICSQKARSVTFANTATGSGSFYDGFGWKKCSIKYDYYILVSYNGSVKQRLYVDYGQTKTVYLDTGKNYTITIRIDEIHYVSGAWIKLFGSVSTPPALRITRK